MANLDVHELAVGYGDQVQETEPFRFYRSRLRARVWDKSHGQCWYCGVQTNPWSNFCIDLMTPCVFGGTAFIWNLFPCCASCHTLKGNKDLPGFRAFLSTVTKPKFTTLQLQYLQSIGVTLDAYPEVVESAPCHVFWFENAGLHHGIVVPPHWERIPHDR